MRRAARLLVVVLRLTAGAAMAFAGGPPPAPAPLLDSRADVELARTPVPSATRQVGEVRIIRRGVVAVVQTRLDTTILRRAVAEIRAKERTGWPAGMPGHEDAERYVAALERAPAELPRRPVGPRVVRRQRLLIEFVLGADAALVALGPFDYAGGDADPRPAWRGVPTVLELGREYVRGNMQRIVADAFDGSATAAARLAEILPPARSPSGSQLVIEPSMRASPGAPGPRTSPGQGGN